MTLPPPVGRVLIVDDDQDFAELIALALGRLGSHTRVAHAADEAIATAAVFDPHVVLLDLHLPDCDGHELGLRLRALSRRALQVIMLTSDDRHDAQARSEDCGFAAHLIKPVQLRDVARLIALAQMRARLT